MSESPGAKGWPRAPGYLGAPAPPRGVSAAHRLVAIVWGGCNVVGIAVTGFAAYLALVTVTVPDEVFAAAPWGRALGRRALAVTALALALAALVHLANRAVFGWAHGPEPAPEPRALVTLLLAAVLLAELVGGYESLLVHL